MALGREEAGNVGCQLVACVAIGKETWPRFLSRQVRWLCREIPYGCRYALNRVRAFRRIESCRAPGSCSAAPQASAINDEEFAPGTRVRIRTRAAIEETLDFRRRCHGCPFAEPMFQYCGREFRVAKQVKHFFDEARGRMVTCRHVVLLAEVFCDGSGYSESRGCDRTCFFFWHTKWLERLGP